MINRQDVFGYYTVGPTIKTYSKIEAYEAQAHVKHNVRWHFNDEVYSAIDWTKEPSTSIAELYRIRAQQIRDKYDYVVLWYSAGADSDNIFDTFINNDIKLDEVVSLVNYEGTDDYFSDLNAEIFHVAIPKVKKAQEKQPGLQHRIIDISQHMVNHFEVLDLDWIYNHNGLFTALHDTKSTLKPKIKEWADMFAAGKKVGFISGVDKPVVRIAPDQKFYFRFNDFPIDVCVTPMMQMRNDPWDYNELFYWSPELPELVVKQVHILKNILKRSSWQDHIVKPPPTKNNRPYGFGRLLAMYDNGTRKNDWIDIPDLIRFLYPTWYNIPYQTKATSTILYDKDKWFITQGFGEKSMQTWRVGMDKVLTTFGRHTGGDFTASPVIHGKLFCLGE